MEPRGSEVLMDQEEELLEGRGDLETMYKGGEWIRRRRS